MIITAQIIKAVSPLCTNPDLVASKLNSALPKYGVTTHLKVVHFLAQVGEESNFNPVAENLNYSAGRLAEVFPKYFPTLAFAEHYVGSPMAIANRIYANRMGNGNEQSGEGYKYRGRGLIQLTGKTNYTLYGQKIGYDLVNKPDDALQYGLSIEIAASFFVNSGAAAYAELNQIVGVTRCINGGTIGLADRVALLRKASAVCGVRV